MSTAEFLATVSGFQEMSPSDLEDLSERIEEVDFADADLLIKRGAPGDSMLIIKNGAVKVPIFDNNGRVRTIVNLGPRDVVGEMALLTGERRSADVIADGPVRCLKIDREIIAPLLAEHPPLARFLTEILGKRLESAGGIERVGKYRLLGKLGEGATAKVYEALHPGLNRAVAVKMLGHHLVYDQKFRDRFLQEARTIAGLNHPHIVQIYDTEQAYATWFLVMEKIEGKDLRHLMKAEGMMPPARVAEILSQLVEALAYAHDKGIAHRDVKPENAAIDEDGNVKLMDFGIARRTRSEEGQKTMVEGTPAYLAPEAVVGKPSDGRADIYALGIMAFEMLTGKHPFPRANLRELLRAQATAPVPDILRVRPDTPPPLAEFIRGTMIKDPDKRLVDPARLQALLRGDVGEAEAEVFHETIIRVRYRPQDGRRVEKAVSTLRRAIQGVPMADAAVAQLVGAAHAPVEESKAEGAVTGWFAKLAGRGREGESTDTTSTRIFTE